MTPVVGVVVAAYNAERWIDATLASLQAQTFDAWVCVVVDDGSTDGTSALLARAAADDVRLTVITQPNRGVTAARNTGVAALPPGLQHVAFLDSDDLYTVDALAVLVAALEARPDAVGAYGLADFVDESGDPVRAGVHSGRQRDRSSVHGHRIHEMDHDADATFATLAVGGPIWPPAVALHRLADVLEVGCFDESFSSQEDWELYLRLARRGPYVAVDRQLAWYRRHGSNLTGNHTESVYQQDRLRRLAWTSRENTAEQRRQVSHAWRYLEARQSYVLAKHTLASVRGRRWELAKEAAVGTVLCAGLALRPGPPPARRWRLRFTRPAHVPGAQL